MTKKSDRSTSKNLYLSLERADILEKSLANFSLFIEGSEIFISDKNWQKVEGRLEAIAPQRENLYLPLDKANILEKSLANFSLPIYKSEIFISSEKTEVAQTSNLERLKNVLTKRAIAKIKVP